MTAGRWSPFAPQPREPDAPPPAAPPRWFLLLPLLALAAWWPLDCYWKSDDFLALHYVQDFGHVLRDFRAPQYGATDVWWFLRPLITLSFWCDRAIAGTQPFASHFGNALAHGLSALLVALLWTRVLPRRQAFLAGLLWALLPSHAGSISWAVGRVDSYTTVWCLLCLWLACRGLEGHRGARVGSLLALLLALGCKELAFALPPLVLLLGMALAPGRGLGARFGAGLAASWPHFAVFALYLGYRWWALGRLGGYAAAALQPWPMLQGLGQFALDLLDPLRWSGARSLGAALGAPPPAWLAWLGLLPALLAAAALAGRRRWRLLGAALLLFAVAALPTAPFWPAADNVHNLRYFYLPTAALAGLFAAAGWPVVLLALLLWAPALIDVRQDYLRADRDDAAMHRQLLAAAADQPGPLFVAGLPHANQRGTVVQLHFGVDRMLAPPFASPAVPLYALRPAAEVPGVFRLWPADELPFALPGGTTLFFDGPTLLGQAPVQPLPALALEVDGGPLLDLTTPRMQQLRDRTLRLQLRTPGVRPPYFRLTIFTAMGYFACVVQDHAADGEADGRIDLLRFLGGDQNAGIAPAVIGPAQYGLAPHSYVVDALQTPITVDLQPEFPVLVEAGDIDPARAAFVPQRRAGELLRFRFDREFPAWLQKQLNR